MPIVETSALEEQRRALSTGMPFAHFRLAVFFLATAVALCVIGALLLGTLSGVERDAHWILCGSVVATAAIGFLGVLVHRRRVLVLRWRETESYLHAIQRESQKYRMLMEGAADMLLLVEPSSGRVREWNASARDRLGWDVQVAVPPLAELLDAPDLERVLASLETVSERPGEPLSLGEIRLRQRGGTEVVADGRLASIHLDEDRIALLALRDVTLQKSIERELQVRDRLSSIGLLTAGVTHEINNPLEGIANFLRLAEREEDPAARREFLSQVRHGFDRIRDIVRDLLRFARPDPGTGRADLADVVQRALALTTYSDRFAKVAITVDGLDAPLEVVGDPGRLEQVVINLLFNAAAAMGGSGSIRVHATRAVGASGEPGVDLVVDDTGPGVPPQALDKLFDPFYSTSGGTGLGLSVSYGIVTAHRGTLSASNRPEGGARFTVHLPLRKET